MRILRGFFELMPLIMLCYTFLNCRWYWPKIIGLSLIMLLVVNLIRSLNMSFGIHSIFIMLILGVGLRVVTSKPLDKSMKAAALGMTILIISELVFMKVELLGLKVKIDEAIKNQLIWTVMCLPHDILMLVLAFYLKKSRSKFFNFIGLN